MPGLSEVRTGLAGALAAIAGLEVHTYVSGVVNPPAAVVVPAASPFLEYQTMDGGLLWHMRIVLLVSQADAEQGTADVDAFLEPSGPKSIPAAITAGGHLGGAASYAVVTEAGQYGKLNFGGIDYLGCEISVEVASP